MELFEIDAAAGRSVELAVDEIDRITPEHVRSIVEIDLQTFAEPTFSVYTATTFLVAGRVFFLTADGEPIGAIVGMRTWSEPDEVLIVAMGIKPGWRGRGIGQRFLVLALERLRAAGVRLASVVVGAGNRRALKVYKDVGFETVCAVDAAPTGSADAMLLLRAALVPRQ